MKKIVIWIIIVLIIFLGIYIFNKNKFTFKTSNKNVTIEINKSEKIEYEISDQTANIMWKSNDNDIVTVDNNGIIYGKNIGNTTIEGKATKENQEKTIIFNVQVINGNPNIPLEDIIIPDGEILIPVNKDYYLPITFVPNNGYASDIDYWADSDIISIKNGKIQALKEGSTILHIKVNDNITKVIKINIINTDSTPQIINPTESITINSNQEIYTGETKKIEYTINPDDGTIFKSIWKSSDNSIVSVDENGTITGIKEGNAKILVTFNNDINKTIYVTVRKAVEDIKLSYIPKKIIKVGNSFKINPTVIPESNQNIKLIYESNNPNILSVNEDGIVEAKANGSATITIKDPLNTINKTLSFIVVPNKGIINSTQYIWEFNKNEDVIPTRADLNFFNNLAKNGKGIVNNNNYIYQKYSYNINDSILTINGKEKILMRMYYPENTDLSKLNTFTFIGGVGETDFNSYFSVIDKNRSAMKSSGIIILIPDGKDISHKPDNVIEATNFVKLIINQSKYAKNAIGGYSNGGPIAGEAAHKGNYYDKIMLYNTSFYYISSKPDLANTEIVVYKAKNDSWKGTDSMIRDFIKYNYKNVTIITNDEKIANDFGNNYLVVNPKNNMESGHGYNNLTKSHFFSYGCD